SVTDVHRSIPPGIASEEFRSNERNLARLDIRRNVRVSRVGVNGIRQVGEASAQMSDRGREVLVSERPSEMITTARVVRMYYLEDRSKSDIALEVGVSRFKVARLLDLARRIGMVNIEIRSVDSLDAELSLKLQSTWGLEHAV